MPAEWLLPLAMGALSTAGQVNTNRQNRDIMREQMNFQERMSSTAVRRSVEDYRAAGLNPALAYDRSASSPSGGSTQMGDAISTGITSALSAQRARQELELQRENLRNIRASTGKLASEAQESAERQKTIQQERIFALAAQPAHLNLLSSQAMLSKYLQPEALNKAEWEKRLRDATLGTGNASMAAKFLQMLRGVTR